MLIVRPQSDETETITVAFEDGRVELNGIQLRTHEAMLLVGALGNALGRSLGIRRDVITNANAEYFEKITRIYRRKTYGDGHETSSSDGGQGDGWTEACGDAVGKRCTSAEPHRDRTVEGRRRAGEGREHGSTDSGRTDCDDLDAMGHHGADFWSALSLFLPRMQRNRAHDVLRRSTLHDVLARAERGPRTGPTDRMKARPIRSAFTTLFSELLLSLDALLDAIYDENDSSELDSDFERMKRSVDEAMIAITQAIDGCHDVLTKLDAIEDRIEDTRGDER